VISRGTLIFLIVLVAFAVKLPFERLMERDALAEIEKREKAKLLREYDILEQITISSSKIEVLFSDSVRAMVAFSGSPSDILRRRAADKLDAANAELRRLEALFGQRDVSLSQEVENDITGVLSACDSGLRLEAATLAGSLNNATAAFYEAHRSLLAMHVKNLLADKQAYLTEQRKKPWWIIGWNDQGVPYDRY